MIKVSIFILFLFLLSNVFAQDEANQQKLGYYIDINNKLLAGYYDPDYDPDQQLNVTFSIGGKETPGYYFDRVGNKVKGFLKFTQSFISPVFRSTINAPDETITTNECSGFVIGKDSFAIIRDFDVERMIGGFHVNKRQFAEVVEQVDNLTFYKHTRLDMNNIVYTYLVKADSSDKLISFPKSQKKFKEICLQIFAGSESLKNQIMEGKYIDEDIPVMAKLLKYNLKSDRNERIYYNSSWDEIETSEKSSYYAVIESVKESVFHLKYFSKNDILLYEGNYTSFFPEKKIDKFTWYYPNGEIRKTTVYLAANNISNTIYFPNGNIHIQYIDSDQGTFYSKIMSLDGKEILDKNGAGIDLFYDSITNRQLTVEFASNKLISSFYTGIAGRKIYQISNTGDKNKDFSKLKKKFIKIADYPMTAINDYTHGVVLVKCIIEPSGLASDIKIIKGINNECDSIALSYLNSLKDNKFWTPDKIGGQKVTQEIIIPVDFSIIGFSRYRNNYNMFWMQNNNMMMQNRMSPTIPILRTTF